MSLVSKLLVLIIRNEIDHVIYKWKTDFIEAKVRRSHILSDSCVSFLSS